MNPADQLTQLSDQRSFQAGIQKGESVLIDAPGANDFSQWRQTEQARNRAATDGIIREKILGLMEDRRGYGQEQLKVGRQLDLELMEMDPGHNANAELYRTLRMAFDEQVTADLTREELYARVQTMLSHTEATTVSPEPLLNLGVLNGQPATEPGADSGIESVSESESSVNEEPVESSGQTTKEAPRLKKRFK